ncbi:MAG TPA: hypothetical protein VFJ65_02585 [Solirubrobacterales bacterium]|nr:hypothetical protein [Solirubrobacterales bacterium]
MRRLSIPFLAGALLALALLGAGCGESSVSAGATVTVYAAAPLCKEAEDTLAREGAQAGEVRVRITCLPPVERHGRADLATAGANARRTTEDSTSIAYLEAPGPAAKFSEPILESASIAWLETRSGATATRRILKALEERGSKSPREAVLDQVS